MYVYVYDWINENGWIFIFEYLFEYFLVVFYILW